MPNGVELGFVPPPLESGAGAGEEQLNSCRDTVSIRVALEATMLTNQDGGYTVVTGRDWYSFKYTEQVNAMALTREGRSAKSQPAVPAQDERDLSLEAAIRLLERSEQENRILRAALWSWWGGGDGLRSGSA